MAYELVTVPEMPMVPKTSLSDWKDGFYTWSCVASNSLLILRIPKSSVSISNREEKLTKVKKDFYYSCLDKLCCFLKNNAFYVNFQISTNTSILPQWPVDPEAFQKVSTLSYESSTILTFLRQELSNPSDIKAVTKCHENQCTWLGKSDSRIQLKFDFPRSLLSSMDDENIQTRTMWYYGNFLFSCSAGFCYKHGYLVNFQEANLKDSHYYDWMHLKKFSSAHVAPKFVLRLNEAHLEMNCKNDTFCTWKCSNSEQEVVVEFIKEK
ncbi:hypothetical protein HMI56_004029 [Coelomomyces lativittatus]|nr:hypothetical protein HMI56_004029 [Coelomomyces lativittatus]